MKPLCAAEGCDKPIRKRQFCQTHYMRFMRSGNPAGKNRYKGAAVYHLNYAIADGFGRECLFWPFNRNNKGYGYVNFEGKSTLVHRISCETINGPPPFEGAEAAHNCNNGHLGCFNGTHLEWKSKSDNEKDKIANGTRNIGARNGRSVLTEDQVIEILRIGRSLRQWQIAEMFGVSQGCVSEILVGNNWRHVSSTATTENTKTA